MGKRSPILGYNHNVRYRGLVFHVQTEDSGVSTPHLFTHLFHAGVIVSTRKLVYDAGSAEESIKSLMQAQHKATLKDLRRGHFDDKIDSYLGGTPGLLPRGAVEDPGRAGDSDLAPSLGTVEELAIGAPTEQVLPMMLDDLSAELSAPVAIVEKTPPPSRTLTPPPIPRPPTERSLPPVFGRGTPLPIDTTLKTEAPVFATSTADPASEPEITELDSFDLDDEPDAPEIEIRLEPEDHHEARSPAASGPRRSTRDTEIQPFLDQTRPTLEVPLDDHTRPTLGMVNEEARRASMISDGIPALRPSAPAIPPLSPDSRRLGDRPSTINAATLPPARPISRPAGRPALSQPQVVSRPVTSDDRSRREPEAVEVYSPAPASAERPPGVVGERPGQYAQHKKSSARIPVEGLKNERSERSGGIAIPAGLGRPHRSGTSPASPRPSTGSPGVTAVAPVPPPPAAAAPPMAAAPPAAVPASAPVASTPVTSAPVASAPVASASAPVASAPSEAPRINAHTEPVHARAPTPSRIAPSGAGMPRVGGGSSSGVVMTRPAVIVGGPPKSVGTVPRIRKAREEEGRGFGQGLISEKSLDEVILAYLSEDADEK